MNDMLSMVCMTCRGEIELREMSRLRPRWEKTGVSWIEMGAEGV